MLRRSDSFKRRVSRRAPAAAASSVTSADTPVLLSGALYRRVGKKWTPCFAVAVANSSSISAHRSEFLATINYP